MSTLYLEHFGLDTPPFSITPDPKFFFAGAERGLFIAGLLHAALQAEGIVLVIGEVGSGKTLMSRMLLAQLPDNVDSVYLPNPAFSRDEILNVIARDLNIDSQYMPLESLQLELIRRHELGRQVVVLIDEAHAMPADAIEEVRRLSNLETDEHKLIQLILCGQPELDTLLATPQLRQVRDRVVYRLMLRSLQKNDAASYLEHRLRIAGWRGGRLFSRMAEQLLLTDANGRIRRLNLIADKSLLAAYAQGQHQVSLSHVHLAIRDTGANFSSSSASSALLTLIAPVIIRLTRLFK
jgi:MSHA biogenesis protein MshM